MRKHIQRKKLSSTGGFNKSQPNASQQKGLLTWKKDEIQKPKENKGRMVPFLSQEEMNERRAK